ncbi:MAG: glycosyltransferase family 4 protein [Muribaculum sp.]|nr:glycosyltransferase family 4 protein [Muribaculum sp.]
MNVLFLSLIPISDINESGIYSDLLREFHKNGHNVSIVFPSERRNGEKTSLVTKSNIDYLRVWTLNSTKCNFIEKGISTILIELQFKLAIKKFLGNIKYDIVIYATPPITFANVVKYVKRRDKAITYLLLKDIFPQNAVDLGLFKRNSFLHKFFRNKEKQLYQISDYIGCMSPANARYIIKNNPELPIEKVEINPNSIEISPKEKNDIDKESILAKYAIPLDKYILIYGGNLGKPQSIPFLIDCLRREADNSECFFIIVGSGTDYHLLEDFIKYQKPSNVRLYDYLPKKEFEDLVTCCDAGMIFLDSQFTIPNYPSRLLSYLTAGIPIVAATDKNTDIRELLEHNNIGVWCESDNVEKFHKTLIRLRNLNTSKESINKVLRDKFDIVDSYKTIIKHINEDNCK